MIYEQELKDLYTQFHSSPTGLNDKQVKRNRELYGENQLVEKEGISPLQIFFNQFKSIVVWILIGALVISLLIGYFSPHENGDSYIDALVIGVIIILNALLGFIQEYRAEKSIEALKRLAALQATVLRNNKKVRIDAKEIVPGDILCLESGDRVSADSRLLEAIELQAQEAALTGESTPVSKNTSLISGKVPLGDQKNMMFSSTEVTRGRGTALVVATGMKSEIGKIARMISDQAEKETPLQKSLDAFGKKIGLLTLGICLVVLIIGFLREGSFTDIFLISVSLAVAAIPEGLPTVVTIALALGIKRMIARHSLIRKLPSVETLGCTTVICSDKTGTLTHNQMTVVKVFVDNCEIDVSGNGYAFNGTFSQKTSTLRRLLEIGVLCNDAEISKNSVIGDPTEGSLIVCAAKLGINKATINKKNPRLKEIPFDSERKLMTTVHKINGKTYAYVKGAPDKIIHACKKIEINGKIVTLPAHKKILLLHQNDKFAEEALRVLGFAYKEVSGKVTEDNLIFVGLQAMIDPPREEVKQAIAKCHTAGIKVVMITGDHITTAKAIASQLGIIGKAITGEQLDKMKDFSQQVEHIAVYARVNPEHKLQIVEAFQKKGHVVAMTGDGVNDAPAIKKADIGIAMGISGTDVAKEASQMILTDDNFTSIVAAVEEGRGIYSNIKKFVSYLLSSNIGEVLTIFIAIMIGYTGPTGAVVLPLIAVQLLWMNLLTDGLPALALGVHPTEQNVMHKPPRHKKEVLLSVRTLLEYFVIGSVMMVGTLWLFHTAHPEINPIHAQTVAFTAIVLFQLMNVLNYISEDGSIFGVETFRNKWLWFAIAASLALQLIVVYVPLFQTIFHTEPLVLTDWYFIIATSVTVIVTGEVMKYIRRMLYAR